MKKITVSILTILILSIGVAESVNANERFSDTKSQATITFRQGAEIPDPNGNVSVDPPYSEIKLPQTGEHQQLWLSLVGLMTVGAGGNLLQRRIKSILK